MKGFLIGPDNERFEAEIVRYFQNVNDHYLIYTKNEKDANGYVLLYITKVISDSGIKVGENITDENEWALIKSFLQKTVSENKEGRPLTIEDSNPAEVADLKINSQRPFKLSEASVELFGKNKKSFEIVQKMAEEQNTVKVPVAPEVTEFVTPVKEENTFDNAFSFEEHVSENTDTAVTEEIKPEESKAETPVESTPSVEPVAEKVKNKPVTLEETKEERPVVTENYEELYKQELDKNDILNKEIEQLRKANEQYLEKLNKLKELLG